MNSKYGRTVAAGRGLPTRGMKETGRSPLGRVMGSAQPRVQNSGGAAPLGLRAVGTAERTTGAMDKGRLWARDSGGVARNSCAASQDETFHLQQCEAGQVRPFAMAIRLTPELLSDLKRAEAEGSACLMKFGFNATGHVLKIGDEEFKFNSAREGGGLCDVFEERRRGEDGNGLLKDAGSVWRKLSVPRTLNASEKDRVKKRSVEAQQLQKSRKAIILDPAHSQSLNHNSTAVDAVGRRPSIKSKVQPPRQKCKPNSPVLRSAPAPAAAPVLVQKPVESIASAIANAKAAIAASVASPELPSTGKVAFLPPSVFNGKPVAEEGSAPSMASAQMDSSPSPATTTPDTTGPPKPEVVVSSTLLRNCLITLLTDNPKGMTLKAVEKSLGDSVPHVKPEKKTIEKAIRAIASYHAPGKYILKEGVAFAKPSPNSGSSPEDAAADSPFVDSPALPDMNVYSSIHEEIPVGPCHNEAGVLEDMHSALHSSATGIPLSIVQKGSENAVSRAIRKASESYQKYQPRSQPDHIVPTPATNAQLFGKTKMAGVDVETERIRVGGDESGDIQFNESGGCSEIYGVTEVQNLNGGAECVPNSLKDKAHSGGSESTSSSGSSDSESESSDSGDSRSGTSGSGSDSGGSSSDSDDENMDEDVEIVSDDEDGGPPHQKPKANDKKKASQQSKEAKRAKLKSPATLPTLVSKDVGIRADKVVVHPLVDAEERASVVVESLDTDDLEVDNVSVGGGDSPRITGSVSPAVSEQQRQEECRDFTVVSAAVEVNRDLLQASVGRGSYLLPSKEKLLVTDETGVQKYMDVRKHTDLDKPIASALKGNTNSMAINRICAKSDSANAMCGVGTKEFSGTTNNRPSARVSYAQSSSPSRAAMGTQPLSGSPALMKDLIDTSPQLAKENSAKRRVDPEVRKSFSKEVKADGQELADMLLVAPMQTRLRPGKLAELSRVAQHADAPHSLCVGAKVEFGARGFRDGEGSGFLCRESEAEVSPNESRLPRDGPWRQNSDGLGLLGKPGNFGRPQVRETEAIVPSSRQLTTRRIASSELDAARRNDATNDLDWRKKPRRDLDGTKLGNDCEVSVNRFRKALTRSEGSKGSLCGSLNRENENRVRQSPDRESGEWKESTPGMEQLDIKEKSRHIDTVAISRPVFEKSQNRELRQPSPGTASGDLSKRLSPIKSVEESRNMSPGIAVGELRKVSPVKAVGDLRNPSPVKAAGDLRKQSPVTFNVQKLVQVALKEPHRFDQVVVRDSNRAVSGLTKGLSFSQVVERAEGGSSRNNRASSDTLERPVESRGVKRPLDDGSTEPPRAYKKSSAALSSSFNRGASELGAARSTEKSSAKEAMEPPRGSDWKAKISGGLLGPGGEKKNENLQSDLRLSNGKLLKSSSSPEEVSGRAYFAKYEKHVPDLRGLIRSPEEAAAYKMEYKTKYHVYIRLYNDLDRYGGHFLSFKREMLLATSHPDKLQQINTKVRRDFHAIRKEFKRMQKTFDILHDELQKIKYHLRIFAGKAGQG